MKTLYIHIGTHKTATTSIQHFLYNNGEVLNKKGYIYPDYGFIYPYVGPHRNGLFLGLPYIDHHGVRHKDKEIRFYNRGMEITHELFKTYDNIILSNERLWMDFYKGQQALLRKVIEDSRSYNYRIVLIIYLRRQDQFIESYWNEHVKSNVVENRPLQEYINSFRYLDYYKVLNDFGDLIGDENIKVRRFSDAVSGDGILSDFMSQIGLQLTDEYNVNMDDAEKNPSLFGNVTEIKRRINQTEGLTKNDAAFIKNAMWLSSDTSRKFYPCSELSEEDRADLLDKYEQSNKMIVDRFIKDERPLFSDDYSGLPKREEENPEFLNDVIRSFAAGDVILLRRLKELEKRVDVLEAKLEKQSLRLEHLRHPIRTLFGKK